MGAESCYRVETVPCRAGSVAAHMLVSRLDAAELRPRTQRGSGLAACRGEGPHPPARCALGRGAASIWPAPGSRGGAGRAPAVAGCGAAVSVARVGRRGAGFVLMRNFPCQHFGRTGGEGTAACRVSTRSCSRLNEFLF